MDFLYLMIKLIVALAVVLGLFSISVKYSNKGLSKINEKKYVKVIDRVQISKESFIVIVRLGEKGMVLLTTQNHTEKLEELSEEKIREIEENKKDNLEQMSQVFNKVINKIKLKEEKNGKIKKEKQDSINIGTNNIDDR